MLTKQDFDRIEIKNQGLETRMISQSLNKHDFVARHVERNEIFAFLEAFCTRRRDEKKRREEGQFLDRTLFLLFEMS